MNLDVKRILDDVYLEGVVKTSMNATGVATNLLLAVLILEIRKMNKAMGVPADEVTP